VFCTDLGISLGANTGALEIWSDVGLYFNGASIPLWISAALILFLGISAAMLKGHRLLRPAFIAICVFAFPYFWSYGLAACSTNQEFAHNLIRFGVGPLAILGPCLFVVLLATTGTIDRYMPLFVAAVVMSLVSCVLCWTTDLVISGVWMTDWGIWAPKGGPLNEIHVFELAGWGLLGAFLGMKNRDEGRSARRKMQSKQLILVLILCALGTSDSLLARDIGVYPFSVLTVFAVVPLSFTAILKNDLLHRSGFYKNFGLSVLVFVLFVAVSGAILSVGTSSLSLPLWQASLLIAPLFVGMQLLISKVGGPNDGQDDVISSADASQSLEIFVDKSSHAKNEREVAILLSELLESITRMTNVELLQIDEQGQCFRVAKNEDAVPQLVALDSRIKPWLIKSKSLIVVDDLRSLRLGGLRQPVEKLIAQLDSELVYPLVDREKLVGFVTASSPGGRALFAKEVSILKDAANSTASSLTYIALKQAAEERMEVAKEVEVAAAVKDARSESNRDIYYNGCNVHTHFLPAKQFGGDWSTTYELADGRVLVAIGDVTGYGVSAALVAFTIEGAIETAQRMLGVNFEVLALMQLLNDAVLEVGGEQYAMSCFAAVFDIENMQVTYTNAGHLFPYLCRHPEDPEKETADLTCLVSRGTPLGSSEPILSVGCMDLEKEDVVVFYSDSLVESRNEKNKAFGERRFQRFLRNNIINNRGDTCQAIIDHATDFYGHRAIEDDVNLVVVKVSEFFDVDRESTIIR